MKTYGLIVADNGSDMYIQGTYDTRWNNDVLNPAFASLKASDFEVIQLGWQPAVGTSTAEPRLLHPHSLPRARHPRPLGPWGGAGPLPRLAAGAPDDAGACGIPAAAKAVSVNVTVAGATAGGHLIFFPGNADGAATRTIQLRAPGRSAPTTPC